MKKQQQSGFTIMELMVVITCIAILVSVTIAALNTSRNRGADASIKTQMNAIRTQATLYLNANGTYGAFSSGACPSVANTTSATTAVFYDSEIKKHTQSAGLRAGGIGSGSGGTAVTSQTACAANGANWAAVTTMKGSNTTGWCVDSLNAGRVVAITADTPTTGYSLVTYTCN